MTHNFCKKEHFNLVKLLENGEFIDYANKLEELRFCDKYMNLRLLRERIKWRTGIESFENLTVHNELIINDAVYKDFALHTRHLEFNLCRSYHVDYIGIHSLLESVSFGVAGVALGAVIGGTIKYFK